MMVIFQKAPIPSYRKERKIVHFVKNVHFTEFFYFYPFSFNLKSSRAYKKARLPFFFCANVQAPFTA